MSNTQATGQNATDSAVSSPQDWDDLQLTAEIKEVSESNGKRLVNAKKLFSKAAKNIKLRRGLNEDMLPEGMAKDLNRLCKSYSDVIRNIIKAEGYRSHSMSASKVVVDIKAADAAELAQHRNKAFPGEVHTVTTHSVVTTERKETFKKDDHSLATQIRMMTCQILALENKWKSLQKAKELAKDIDEKIKIGTKASKVSDKLTEYERARSMLKTAHLLELFPNGKPEEPEPEVVVEAEEKPAHDPSERLAENRIEMVSRNEDGVGLAGEVVQDNWKTASTKDKAKLLKLAEKTASAINEIAWKE